MHNNRSHRVSYFRSASYRSVALSSTSLLLAMFSARRPTYHHVFIDGLFFLYLRIMRQICISAMRSICRAQIAPLRRMGGTINGEIIQEGTITQNYVGKCILWIIKSYFPNAIRISTDRGISIQGRNWFSLIAVAVTHPRFLDVFHLKKKLVHVRVLAASGFLETRRVFFFFFYFQSSERFNRGKPTFDRANLPSFFYANRHRRDYR